MKAIVIGTSLSGKTTLVRYLRSIRSTTIPPISEIDEELTRLNHGVFPSDNVYKYTVLAPQVIHHTLGEDSILFLANTDYFAVDDLKKAREKGFIIIQLHVGLDLLKMRNEYRMQHEGYADMGPWLEGMVQYQEKMQKLDLVDVVIDADQSVKYIAKILQNTLIDGGVLLKQIKRVRSFKGNGQGDLSNFIAEDRKVRK